MAHDHFLARTVSAAPPESAVAAADSAASAPEHGALGDWPRRITAGLLQTLRDHAAETESAGRLAPASVDALRRAGCFSADGIITAWQDPRQLVSDLRQIGSACPASAWVVALTTAVTGLLPFASETARSALAAAESPVIENFGLGSLAVHGEGFLLNGTWPYCSGSEVATWAMLGAVQLEDGRPRMRMVIVPTATLRLVRTWDVTGLRGTGTNTFVAEDVVVTSEFVFDLPVDPAVTGRAMLLTTTLTAAAIVGMATGALDIVTTLMRDAKGPSRTRYASSAESPAARALFLRARGLVTDAAARVEAVAAEVARHPIGADTEPLDLEGRLELRRTLIAAVHDVRSAVDDLLDLHGSSAMALSNPLQRFWRDIGVGSRHAGLRRYLLEEDLARVLLGQDDFAIPRW